MRLLALGDAYLLAGFKLLGFETHVDPTPAELESLLCGLITRKEKALVLIEQALLQDTGPCYQRIRNDSGHVMLVALPPLHDPDAYLPPVEELVKRVLGPNALMEPEQTWDKPTKPH